MSSSASAPAAFVEPSADQINRKASQLKAMLATTHGEGFGSFDGLSDKMKNNYLWACANLAQDITALSRQLQR